MLKEYLQLPRLVHLLCLGAFINRAATFLVPFLTLYLQKHLNLGVEFATTAYGAFGLGAIVAAAVGGHLADLFGRRAVMLFSLLGSAAILVFFNRFTSPAAIVAAIIVFSLVGEMYRPAASAMIADLTTPALRPLAFGLMYFAVNLGFAVGPAIVAQLLIPLGFQWLFRVDALTSAIYALMIALLIPETLPLRAPRDSAARTGLSTPPAETGDAQVSLLAAARHIITDYPFLIFCAAVFFNSVVYMQSMSTFPLYLADFHIDEKAYARLIAINGLMIVCLQLPLTAFLRRFSRAAVMIVATVIMAVGFGLVGRAATPAQFAGTVIIWTLGEIMQFPYISAVVSDMAPVPLRARYMGALGMSFSTAMLLGAPVGGRLLTHGGGHHLWTACFIVLLASALCYALIYRKIDSRR
jgi:MFS family permease